MEVKNISTDKLKPYENNPRINDGAVDAVAASIKEFGFRVPIVIDNANVIVCGHTRWKAAKKLKMKTVPCVTADDLTPEQIKAFRIADNQTASLADWELSLLGSEIDALKEMDFDIDLLGFKEGELDELLAAGTTGGTEGLTDPDDVPEPPKVAKTKLGDLYVLGGHRLLCGDSTKAEDVARLMDGQKADMMFTDPPYGVNYVGKTKDKLTIKSDDLDEADLGNLISSVFDLVDTFVRDGAYVVATVPAGPLHLIFAMDWKLRGWLRQILFGWKPGERLKNDDRTKTTVWDFERPKASRLHPTMKPVVMWEYGINNHTLSGDLLYEPFTGSGTTLIACEKTGRRCFGMELEPVYCDVIVKRWEDFTGKKAVLSR